MKNVTAADIAASLAHSPRSIPVVVNGHAALAVEPIRGHVVHASDGVWITDDGEAPAVDAVAIRFGPGVPMALGEMQKQLALHGPCEVFTWGRRVEEIRFVRAYYDYDAKRHVIVRDPGILSMVATPMFTTILHDGTSGLSHEWARPA